MTFVVLDALGHQIVDTLVLIPEVLKPDNIPL
jgi:hypothetical protein